MRFNNTEKLLRQYGHDGSVTIEKVTELVRSIFADVRYQTGKPVVDCAVDRMDLLAQSLCAVVNELSRIFERNRDALSSNLSADRVRTAENKCVAARKELTLLTDDITSLQRLEAELRDQLQLVKQADEEKGVLHSRCDALRRELKELENDDPESEAGKLKEQIRSLQERLNARRAEYETSKRLYADLSDAAESKEREYSTLLSNVAKVRNQLANRNKELEDQRAVIDQLRNQIAVAEKGKLALEQECNTAQKEIETCKLAVQQLHKQKEQYDAELSRADAQKNQLEEQVDSLQKKLDDLVPDRSALEQKSKDLQALYEQHLKACEEARAKNQTLAQEIEVTQQALQNAQKEEAELSTQMAQAKIKQTCAEENNTKFRKEYLEPIEVSIQEREQEYAQQQKKYAEQEAEVESIRNQLSDIASRLILLNSEKEVITRAIAGKDAELSKAKKDTDDLKKRKSDLDERVRVEAAEQKKLVEAMQDLERILDGKNVSRLREDIESRTKKLQEQIEQANQEEKHNRELEQELLKSSDHLNKVETEVQIHKEELENIKSACEAAEKKWEAISSDENNKRICQMKNRLELLRRIESQLCVSIPGIEAFRMEETMASELKHAQGTLDIFGRAIEEYLSGRQGVF